MRLNKEVCKRCLAKARQRWGGSPWDAHDEELWECGSVQCEHGSGGIWGTSGISVECASPPEWCSYLTEHLVCQTENPAPSPI